jgi:hypothetical protein
MSRKKRESKTRAKQPIVVIFQVRRGGEEENWMQNVYAAINSPI